MSNNILAIDSSTEACSVALLFNDEITHNFIMAKQAHTKQILPMIDSLLRQSGCALSQLDAIAFGKGPGSFTGVRIGIGVAQGLALGIDKPMIGISTLATLAQGTYRISNAKTVIAAIDARMAEVYLGAYNVNDNEVCQPIIEEIVIKPAKVSDYLSHCHMEGIYFAGSGWQTYPTMINGLNDGHHVLPEAQDMLAMAKIQLINGNVISVENAEATYLRNEVTWQKLPGRN